MTTDAGAAAPARLAVADLEVRFPGRTTPALAGVSVSLHPGEVVGVRGRSGSGKTSLLHAVAGLLPWARAASVRGTVVLDGEPVDDLDPAQRARLVGTALDRPSAQLFLATPRHELDAARRRSDDAPLLGELIGHLGLPPLLDRKLLQLSSGQRQRVALACALAAAPRPVLLDEPTTHLDDDGVRGLRRALAAVTGAGGTVLLTEQAGWRLGTSVSRWLSADAGAVLDATPPRAPSLAPAPRPPAGDAVLATDGLTVARGGHTLVDAADVAFRPGEVVLLTGANGSGKSSLALALAGHLAPVAGRLSQGGRTVRRPRGVALILPEADTQLFGRSVDHELELAGAAPGERRKVLRRHRLEHRAEQAPWTLSRGERQRLLHAALDVLRPALMIIDEPGQGLDPDDLEALAELIRIRAARGRSYLLVSHRAELGPLAHRILTLRGGRLTAQENP